MILVMINGEPVIPLAKEMLELGFDYFGDPNEEHEGLDRSGMFWAEVAFLMACTLWGVWGQLHQDNDDIREKALAWLVARVEEQQSRTCERGGSPREVISRIYHGTIGGRRGAEVLMRRTSSGKEKGKGGTQGEALLSLESKSKFGGGRETLALAPTTTNAGGFQL